MDNKKNFNNKVQQKNVVNNSFKARKPMDQNNQGKPNPEMRRTVMNSARKEPYGQKRENPTGTFQNKFVNQGGPRENFNMANKHVNLDSQPHNKERYLQNNTHNKQSFNGQNTRNFGDNNQ